MGHTAITFGPLTNARMNSRSRRLAASIRERIHPAGPTSEERHLLRIARSVKPDVLLVLTQTVSEETLAAVKKIGMRTVAWWGDAAGNMPRMGLLSDQWDLIFLKDRDTVEKFRRVGLPAQLLHEAMNPAWHRPMSPQSNDSVAIVGNSYGFRQFLTLRLIQAGIPVELYGPPLPRWSLSQLRSIHTGRYVVTEEKSRIFGGALACLNSTALIEGNSLNCRAFEIAGAGGLQIMEFRPAIEECFEPTRELLTFASFAELLEHVEWAKKNPAGAQRVRLAGCERARAHHTYAHRLKRIIDQAS